MPWTTQDLANIDAAIASGVKEVRFQERTTVFQSISELQKARTDIVNYLTAHGGQPMVRVVRAYTKSGW